MSHEASLLPRSRLRFAAEHTASAWKFASISLNAAGAIFVKTSIVARDAGSVIKGSSSMSSIERVASCSQIRSYSRRTSSSVGCGDHSIPKCRSADRRRKHVPPYLRRDLKGVEPDSDSVAALSHCGVQIDVAFQSL